MERLRDGGARNKLGASLLLAAAVAVTMVLSWIASPDPFASVVKRSVPVIIMFSVLIAVTITSASIPSRMFAAAFFFTAAFLYVYFFTIPEWGVPHAVIGLTFVVDMLISASGCRSPMVSNANDNFLAAALLFAAGFIIGLFFEFMNGAILHLWSLNTISFYPMASMFGINLLVLITWAFVGILLHEFSLLIAIAVKIARDGRERECTI